VETTIYRNSPLFLGSKIYEACWSTFQ
jgi:hypothetical protein